MILTTGSSMLWGRPNWSAFHFNIGTLLQLTYLWGLRAFKVIMVANIYIKVVFVHDDSTPSQPSVSMTL